MQFSPQQDRALTRVARWLRDPGQQVFRLFGYAGTGKTTLARHLAEGVEGRVLFGAFTGKAAYVLQQKGCDASTLHKLIYVPRSKSSYRLHQLREKLKDTTSTPDHDREMVRRLEKEIKAEEQNLSRPMFQLNLDSPLNDAELLVVDEVSMVNEEMGRDLESFGCKILVLGDPAQLPPVYGGGYFIDAEPDVMLTEIHRQAEGNPIIHLATELRNHRIPDRGAYGESRVMTKRDLDAGLVTSVDQLLVGKNVTRKRWNGRVREILGRTEKDPEPGDRLVCLRNDHEAGLLNGGIWRVREAFLDPDDERLIDMALTPEEGSDQPTVVSAHRAYFHGEEPEWWDKKDAQEFDYGYALTCHKAQGSQWGSVLVYDERIGSGHDRYKWLYTAVTRAAERVHLVQ